MTSAALSRKSRCRECDRLPPPSGLHGRGLCSRCYRNPDIRRKHDMLPRAPKKQPPICLHCKEKKSFTRGLCAGCYYTPGVRETHPPAIDGVDKGALHEEQVQKYPGSVVPARCAEHGKRDGECAECERRQREKMQALVQEESNEDF